MYRYLAIVFFLAILTLFVVRILVVG